MRMLTDVLDPRRNSLNALRLALAVLVIVSHAWPLNGFDGEPALGGMTLGAWAVLGFFGLSGYLITVSRLSTKPAIEFWIARALRILPGLLVALLVVAFVFAPIAARVEPGAAWSPAASVSFVLRNAPLYPYRLWQSDIPGTLISLPYRDWDGPLWTLFWEGACYVLIGVAVALLGRGRRLLIAMASLAIIAATAAFTHAFDGSFSGLGVRITTMVLAFAVGAVLAISRSRVPAGGVAVGAASVVLGVAVALQAAPVAAAVLLPYLLLVGGAVLPLRRIGRRFDLSYGVYIYAWPVQQMLVVFLGRGTHPALMIGLVVLGTLPLALLSFVLVERPASAMKRPLVNLLTRRPARPAIGGSTESLRERLG